MTSSNLKTAVPRFKSQFPLFQSHLDLSHTLWEKIVISGDLVVDATCGNGQDTLILAKMALENNLPGKVIAIDIQEAAILATKERLLNHLSEEQFKSIDFKLRSHETFPEEIQPGTVKLIVYNLGYLPKGDKSLTTVTSTTIKSVEQALQLICSGGAISITCYPGHREGKIEEEALLEFVARLPPQKWSCSHHTWKNRVAAPSLLIIQASKNYTERD